MPPFCVEDRWETGLLDAARAAGATMLWDCCDEVTEGDRSDALNGGTDALLFFDT